MTFMPRHANYFPDPPVVAAPTGRHGRWIRRATRIASTSEHPTPMAAVAVVGGSVSAVATNVPKNRPGLVPWVNCSRHAEERLTALADLRDATIYVARIRADGSPGNARPCRYCRARLAQAGVKAVVWTRTDSTELGIERLSNTEERPSQNLHHA